MATQEEIKNQLQRLEKFNDPVMLMMTLLIIPGGIMAMFLSSLGDGTLVKGGMVFFFILFTWLAFLISAKIKRRVEWLKSQLEQSSEQVQE